MKTNFITRAAIIAAIYCAITLAVMLTPLGQFAFGPIQVRVSEALTVLPAVFPSAIVGLFVGCLISNIIGATMGIAAGWLDIVFGSLATLLSAWLSYKLRKHTYLVPLPPVLVNAAVVGLLLHYVLELPLFATMLTVGLGQVVACYGIGLPLLLAIKKRKNIIDPEK